MSSISKNPDVMINPLDVNKGFVRVNKRTFQDALNSQFLGNTIELFKITNEVGQSALAQPKRQQ